MRNKTVYLFAAMFAVFGSVPVHAAMDSFDFDEFAIVDDGATAQDMEDASAAAIMAFESDNSLFQQITQLEQEKVLMQLEKERAQLDLELDRLAAEKIKLHMEIDTLSGRAEAQQQELDNERARLETEAARLEAEKEKIKAAAAVPTTPRSVGQARTADADIDTSISDKYRLVNVVGAGNQLQATVEDLNTGQNKRVSVGKSLDGYEITSISLDDGVVFVKDGVQQNLSISSGR